MNKPYEPLQYREIKQHGITNDEIVKRFKETYKPLIFVANNQETLYCSADYQYTACNTLNAFHSLLHEIVIDYPTHLQESLYRQLGNDQTLPQCNDTEENTVRFQNGTYFNDIGIFIQHGRLNRERAEHGMDYEPHSVSFSTKLYINALTGFNIKAQQEFKQLLKRLLMYRKSKQTIIHTPNLQTSDTLYRFIVTLLNPLMLSRATWVALGRGYAKKAWTNKTTLIVKPLSLKYSSVTTPTIIPRLTKPEDFEEQLTLFGSYYPFHQRMNVLVFTDDLRQLQLIAPEDKDYLTVYHAPKLSELSHNLCINFPLDHAHLNEIITWVLFE